MWWLCDICYYAVSVHLGYVMLWLCEICVTMLLMFPLVMLCDGYVKSVLLWYLHSPRLCYVMGIWNLCYNAGYVHLGYVMLRLCEFHVTCYVETMVLIALWNGNVTLCLLRWNGSSFFSLYKIMVWISLNLANSYFLMIWLFFFYLNLIFF